MKIDVRVVAATSKDLEEEVEKGTFRQDLYYRLNVMTLKLPPLNQRTEDIPLLCKRFVNQFNQRLDKDIAGVAPEAMSRLLEYSWPGNVRELENSIERAMVIADDLLLLPEHFPAEMMQNNGHKRSDDMFNGFSLKDAQKIMEKKFITRALEETEGNRTRAAKLLEISHPSLLTKIKAYNIDL